jgi:L-iditol 2-dehydrogenase
MFIRLCFLRGARIIACDYKDNRLELAKKLGAHETVKINNNIDQVKVVRELTEDARGVDVAIEVAGLPSVGKCLLIWSDLGERCYFFGGKKRGQS